MLENLSFVLENDDSLLIVLILSNHYNFFKHLKEYNKYEKNTEKKIAMKSTFLM